MSRLPLGPLWGEAEVGRNQCQPGFCIPDAGQPEELPLLVQFQRRPRAWEVLGVEALMRHLSSSRPEGQCALRRSLKVVWREEGGCSAKIRGQSAGVGPGLDPVLLTVPEVHGERMLTFLAGVPLD